MHLAAPLFYEGKCPFGDCVSRVFRGTSLPKDRLRELHLDGGGKIAARYADTLPDLEARVKTLRGKVAAHLKEMGAE